MITRAPLASFNRLESSLVVQAIIECVASGVGVVFSASAQEADVERAYRLGASAYFRKPATLNELCDLLNIVFSFWTLCLKPILPDKC